VLQVDRVQFGCVASVDDETLLAASHRPELADTAVLLTSEAVTNAINACTDKGCTTPVTLHTGWTDPTRLRILIHDEAPGLPAVPIPVQDAEDGRGIRLISCGADAWGVCVHGPGRGKATWFELGRKKDTANATLKEAADERRKRALALARLAAGADVGDFDELLDKEKHRR